MTDVPTEKKNASATNAPEAVHEEESNDTAAVTRSAPSSEADEEQQQQQQQQKSTEEQQQQQKEEQEEDLGGDIDEEGLLRQGYDVILYGTSLVQSILASALARAGKKVLHCDGADYYGELDAVWTLPYVQEVMLHDEKQQQQQQKQSQQDGGSVVGQKDSSLDAASTCTILSLSARGGLQGFQIHSMSRKEDDEFFDFESECDVMTPFGKGRIVMKQQTITTTKSLSISLTDWKLANGSSYPTLYVGIPSTLDITNRQHATQKDDDDDDDALKKKKNLNRYLVNTAKIIPHQALLAREILDHRSRSIALDISPGLLYAHGPAVQGLLTSRVSDYVEFKSLQGLWWYYHDTSSSSSSSASKTAKSSSANNARLEMVPCSKNDVFGSTLLTPMEKRRLMKFLQLALDYATAQEAAAEAAAAAAQENTTTMATDDSNNNLAIVQSLNERHLNQGRSLARPQNKAVNTSDMETLQECIANEKMDFDVYLQEKHSLSPKLRSLVRFALALEVMGNNSNNSSSSRSDDEDKNSNNNKTNNNRTKPLLVEQGMKRLCRHMQALGRFGSTAFLIPMYGSGELSQAFCRSAAVYGATYVLRRCMRGIVVTAAANNTNTKTSTKATDKGDVDDNDAPRQQQTTGVLISQPTRDESSSSPSPLPLASSSLRDLKQIPCQHVVIPESALLRQERVGHDDDDDKNQQGGHHHHHHVKVSQRRVLRRISILQGKPKVLLLAKQSKEDNSNDRRQCRHAIILPPGSLDGNTNNSSNNGHSSSCPQEYTIQGLVLDESVNVAPHVEPDGCSIVHLSTIIDVTDATTNTTRDGRDDPTGVTEAQTLLLKRALDTIILANDATVQEIFHVSFSFPLYDDDDDESNNNTNLQSKDEERIKGLQVVRRPPPSLTVDPDFEQAREIFYRICPGADFLTLSKEIETAVKERFGDACNPNDADDDEKLVLESAMGMISGIGAASNNTADGDTEPLFIWLGHCRHAEEAEAGPAKMSTHKLLLPVPTPSTPNVTVVENQEKATSEPTTSEQVLKLIQKHYSKHGASSDPRIFFASSQEGDDVMEHSVLIKESIAAVKKAGFSQFSYHVFTSGLVTPPTQIDLVDIGIDCFHVSLFAGSKAEYVELTGRGAKVDGAEEEEECFSKVCGFISKAVQHDIAVEASVIKRYEETGRVLARSLGAREIHVFDQ